ncbi:hypothetical protein MHH70_08575 [Metasolibacillus sp. FSL H7-0170]|uniref:hypothetical protein n=1 Tax=Metasolibacillus sp. FSL H7-0170 TaxID=2921431 RepID=UPI0031581C8E
MSSIVITVINYANEQEVIEYAKMLTKQTIAENLRLVVVNNKSTENVEFNLEDELSKINLNIKVYIPDENLGYLNGCFYGYEKFLECEIKSDIKWSVVSNTDILIEDEKFFEKLYVNKYSEDIWCIAPSIYSPTTQTFQNPQYLERHSLEKLNRIIKIHSNKYFAYVYAKLATFKARNKNTLEKESQFVYSAHGCFFILNPKFMKSLSTEKYGAFLYSEEAFIAESIRKHNKKCFYDNCLKLIHFENSVTGLLGVEKRAKYIKESLQYIVNEFYR